MKIVRVTYTTTAEFAAQNQANIQKVMNDLQRSKHAGINYNVCINPDEKTFVHTAFFRSDDDRKVLNDLPAFKHFQDELKASGPEAPPRQEFPVLVGSSVNIFNS